MEPIPFIAAIGQADIQIQNFMVYPFLGDSCGNVCTKRIPQPYHFLLIPNTKCPRSGSLEAESETKITIEWHIEVMLSGKIWKWLMEEWNKTRSQEGFSRSLPFVCTHSELWSMKSTTEVCTFSNEPRLFYPHICQSLTVDCHCLGRGGEVTFQTFLDEAAFKAKNKYRSELLVAYLHSSGREALCPHNGNLKVGQ